MKNFVDLKNYLIKEIKPQENYQYFIFKELLNSGRQISYDELAERYDAEYENTNKTDTKTILKDAPTSALSRHGYITSDKNNVYANFNEEPLYYKETILWILEKSLDHWAKNKSIKGLEFREGVIKTDKEIEIFCYENNIPRYLVENIILSINRGEKQIILDGPPGTGKTYLIKKIVQFLSSEDSIYDLVQFHPSYGYEEFVEGLRPVTTDTGLKFDVVPGRLLNLLEKTENNVPISKIDVDQIENNINVGFNRRKLFETVMPLFPETLTDDEFDKWVEENPPKYELTINDFKEVFELQKSYSSTATTEMKRREEIVRHELPNKIQNWLNESGFENYKVVGKGNQGRYSKTPWVRVFREEYSSRPSEGYYIVYLFDTIGERVYLSLNRGSLIPGTPNHIPDEEAIKSVKNTREIIKPFTDLIEEKYAEDTENNIVWEIDLVAEEGTTPAAYEKTHIFGFEINKNQDIGAYNADFIDALELLEVVYSSLDQLESFSNIPSTVKGFSTNEDTTISRGGEIILQALRNLGGQGKLKEIYEQVNLIDESIPESSVRRDLQKYSHGSKYYEDKFPEIFRNISSGVWEVVDSDDFNITIEKDSLHNKVETFESFGSHDFLIIDEVNRGNLPKIFGELLNAFEYRDENISLQYSDKPLSVPSNLIFLGTMNSTDKSVGRMDAALRRRFDFIHVEPNYEVLEKYYENKELLVPNLIEGLEILNELLEKDLGKHCLIGHTFFMKSYDSPFTYDDIKKIWDRKIYPLLEEYFLDDITKLEKYKTYRYFWEEVETEESNKKSNNRYSKELLSKHLLEISNEHKELQLVVEKWGEDIENMNIWPGYINTNFRSGGRTLIYTANSNGLSERDGKYHLFKLAGNGNIVLPLHTLYSNDYNRAPFNSREFREVFEKKLIDYFKKFNLKINAEKFFSKSKPSFEMQEIIKTKSIKDFLDIWDWVIEEINNTGIKYE